MHRPQVHRFVALALLAFVVSETKAQVSVSSSLYYGSPYVFRGAVFSSGFVMQPTVQASYGGAFVGFFGNLDPNAGASGNKFGFNEADLFAGYGLEAGALSASATYTYYTFPIPTTDENGHDDLSLTPTQEVALTLGFAAPVAPSLYLVYDFDGDHDRGDLTGFYGELGLSADVPVGGHAYTLGAVLALDGQYLLPETALSHAAFSVSADFAAGGLTISPKVALQVSLDETYRTVLAKPTLFYGGIGIGF